MGCQAYLDQCAHKKGEPPSRERRAVPVYALHYLQQHLQTVVQVQVQVGGHGFGRQQGFGVQQRGVQQRGGQQGFGVQQGLQQLGGQHGFGEQQVFGGQSRAFPMPQSASMPPHTPLPKPPMMQLMPLQISLSPLLQRGGLQLEEQQLDEQQPGTSLIKEPSFLIEFMTLYAGKEGWVIYFSG